MHTYALAYSSSAALQVQNIFQHTMFTTLEKDEVFYDPINSENQTLAKNEKALLLPGQTIICLRLPANGEDFQQPTAGPREHYVDGHL